MRVDSFWSLLKREGFNFWAGVPCSILKPILNNIPKGMVYINATREDSALGLASGAALAGKASGILIQNSGLGNIINGLTSFNLIYRVPILLIITWRGYQGKDAPEHLVMGKATIPFLEIMGIPFKVISKDFSGQIKWAVQIMKDQQVPVALILKDNVIQ